MKDTSWVKQHLQKIFLETLDEREQLSIINSKIKLFGGKLYKYFSFEDPFALENLRNKTIHFSKPEKFNDPFDCALGFSLDKAIEAFVPSIINTQIEPFGENEVQTKELISQLFLGQQPTIVTDDKTAELLCFLFTQEDFKSLLYKYINGEIASENEFRIAIIELLSNPEILNKYFKMLSQPGQEHLFENIGDNNTTHNIFQSLLSNPDSISKIFPETEFDTEKLKGFSLITAILRGHSITEKIKNVAEIMGESGHKIQGEIDKARKHIDPQMEKTKSIINDKFTISCFSEKSDSTLMWSHYANKHTGFCVEYDFTKCKSLSSLIMLFPVIYSSERATVPMSLFDLSNPLHPVAANSNATIPDIVLALLTKSNIWEYENEWRIIEFQSNLADGHLLFSDMVSRVYLGVNTTRENEARLRNIVDRDISIEKYHIDNENYKLRLC